MNRQLALIEAEPESYLNPDKWGFFTLGRRDLGSDTFHSNSYQLNQLPCVMDLINGHDHSNYWISQAVFSKQNRRKVNLNHTGVCFVDLDTYNKPELDGIPTDVLVDRILSMSPMPPSVIVHSGYGLYLKWFIEPIPKQALPRWEAVQRELCSYFAGFGADMAARDASRVLRVVGTYNLKKPQAVPVEVIHVSQHDTGEPARYSFDDLANKVLPVSREVVKAHRATTKPRSKPSIVTSIAGRQALTTNSLNWMRLCDLQKLIEMRGGDMGDGLRELAAFWMCNFYALRYAKDLIGRPMENWHEFNQLSRLAVPHWPQSKIRDKTSNLFGLTAKHARGESVTHDGKRYTPLYTPSNSTLLDTFRIEPHEERQLGTIMGRAERDRRRREKHGWQEHGSQAEYQKARTEQSKHRATQAKLMQNQGLKQREIAARLGITQQQVAYLLKKYK